MSSAASDKPRLAALVVNHNGRHLLEIVLPSLAAQTYRPLEIVVVDDASGDDSLAYLAERWPDVRVVAGTENVGVAATFNHAVQAAQTEYVALLNNDLELAPDCLAELARTLDENADAAVVAAKLLDYDRRDRLDGSGDVYTWAGEANRRGQGEVDRGQYDEPGEVFAACAAAALYRRSALEQVGPFDEQLYAIYEDVDWAFRARLAGYRCLYAPTAVAYHMGSATLGPGLTDFALYQNWRNGIWVVAKNYPLASLLRHAPALAIAQLRNLAWAIKQRRARIWLRVWRDALRGLPAVLAKRRSVQRARTIGAGELERVVDPA
jgi:GT2 family glycosyltransferase